MGRSLNQPPARHPLSTVRRSPQRRVGSKPTYLGCFLGGCRPWPSLTEAVSSCRRESPGFANAPDSVHGPGSATRRGGTLSESLALCNPGFSHL